MPVPKGIELGSDGSDDPRSWSEKYNCQGPEWNAPGVGETLEGNPDGKRPVVGGNTFVRVEAEGDDDVQLDDWMESKIAQAEQSVVAVVKAYMYDEVEESLGGMEKLDYSDLVIGK